jgi:biotin carboxyl carrier protein
MTSKVIVNGESAVYALRRTASGYAIERDGIQREASVILVEPGVYHVLLDDRSFEVRTSGDRLDVDGFELTIEVEDPRQVARIRTGSAGEGRQTIAAPMPGKVVRLLVAPGDPVERDQDVVVIEAMKMQNALKSPKTGRVAEVRCNEGAAVAAGDVLAVVE